MHTTMVPEEVKTMKIQAGIQVSRPRELRRQLQLWKRFGRLYLIVFVLVRNVFTLDYDSQMIDKYFAAYTGIEVKQFRETLLQLMSNMQKQESKVDLGKELDVGLVVMESNGTELEVQDDSSRSGNDTNGDDVDIRPIYDEEPMAEKVKGNSVDTKFAKTSVLGKRVLQSLRNQSVVRQLNAFKSERPPMSKPRFASQVDGNNNLTKLVTQHYLPKRRASAFAKLDPMIASSSPRNSSKNMPRFSSNDMVHNHYLDEARKKTQERDRNSKTSVMPSARFQSTADDSKQKPMSNNPKTRSLFASKSSCVTLNVVPLVDHSRNSSPFSDSKHFVCSTCHKCVFNANHDAYIIKLLNEMNSRAKIQSHNTRISSKPVEQKSHTQKSSRQIFTGYSFSPNKSSTVYEKTSPRSCLRWKLTGRIFDIVGIRWIPTGKLLDSCTSKVDSKPLHDSNVDISKIHEFKQTLDLNACTSTNVQKKQSIDLSAEVHASDIIVMTSMIELESLFDPLFDEYFYGENQVVSKSSTITTINASDKRQQQLDSTSSTSTLAKTVTADGNFDFKKDESGIVIRNKGRLVAQGHTQEEGIDYDVDDIIFGSIKKELCDEFEKLMKDKFQMSSILNRFLGVRSTCIIIQKCVSSLQVLLEKFLFLKVKILPVGNHLRQVLEATTLRHKKDLITLRIVPRLWSSGPSSIKLSTLEALKGLFLKIVGAITLSLVTTVVSREEGAEFKVIGFDKAFDSPTLRKTLDLGRGAT
ncbi:hypothetical protein Tco_0707172 [Tanacetum coccineum]|uniref:Uncharacterized protein n=1 Tax=Tanacetum coccineum TaxID=301880 RepID=A0ABQ4YAI9_9ASTR